MATYEGIAAVSKAVLGLLRDASGTFVHNNALDFELVHPSFFDEGLKGPAITLCLYRVSLNASMRNAPTRRVVQADGQTQVFRAPLPLDLYYLLTAWANNVEMQQRLLGWSMRVLHDTPLLPATLINSHTTDVRAFEDGEGVELTFDQLGLQDWLAVWDKLKPKMQTSVCYIARLVTLQSTSEIAQAAPVQTRIFDLAKPG